MPEKTKDRERPTSKKAKGPEKANGDENGGGQGIWSGTISFGLVSVPVVLYPALRKRPIALRMLSPEGAPVQRRYVCPADGKELGPDELISGYEIDEGRFVTVEDEELEALEPRKSTDIELLRFVDVAEIDPRLFDHPYFLAPGGTSIRAYRLLAHVMERSAKAGIATFLMRGREHLIAIMAEHGILTAQTLRYADELRDPAEMGLPQRVLPDPGLKALLARAIEQTSAESISLQEMEDRYAGQLQELIRKKAARKRRARVKVEPEDEEMGKIIDLVAIFKERFAADRAGTRGRRSSRSPAKE